MNITEKSNDQIRTRYSWFEGHNKLSERLWRDIELVSSTDINILVVGETGTGKEVVARWMHEKRIATQSITKEAAPFVSVNCAAIPENLLESLLFGHERGAFTSARELQRGKFEIANQGTLFLDEIQHLNLSAQSKLLRVLQHREFERLGAKQSKETKCQIVAATNVPLELLVEKKLFRKDLYYRLNICPVYLPALRHRKEDLPGLIKHYLNKVSTNHRIGKKDISPEAFVTLLEYSWPGNLRELEHCLLSACLKSKTIIDENSLPETITGKLETYLREGMWTEAINQ